MTLTAILQGLSDVTAAVSSQEEKQQVKNAENTPNT